MQHTLFRSHLLNCAFAALSVAAFPTLSCSQEATAKPSATVGPFGLTFGMPEKDLRAIVKLEPVEGQKGAYSVAVVPNGHNAFESYFLMIGPKQGLCMIQAIGKTVETSVYGDGLRTAHKAIEELLVEKYGEPKRIDFLRSGSIWNEPRDWMMALETEERVLAAMWDSKLPVGLGAIGIQAIAPSTNGGFVRLTFDGSDKTACEKELSSNPF